MECKTRLNLPQFEIKTRTNRSRTEIWDPIRLRWLVLTPEEWVRQNFIRFMVEHKAVSPMFVKQEMNINLNGTRKRADIVVYTTEGTPHIIVECKAPSIKITQETLLQICRYNMALKLPVVIVTNGLTHYCFRYDAQTNETLPVSGLDF